MSTLHIILVPYGGQLWAAGRGHAVDVPSLMLMAGSAPSKMPTASTQYSFVTAQLQAVYRELQHLMIEGEHSVRLEGPLALPASADVLHAVDQLAHADAEAMLRFVLAFGLAQDGCRCTTLLHHLVAVDRDLFEFVHRHRLESWPVSRYADMLGLPQRKFNDLFKEKYGVLPKRWLLSQRLDHARSLLETSTKKVIDVALESGFGNAAHFSDCFRRHYRMSPTEVRHEVRTVVPVLELLH
ncbi:MAG: helix-turn-helix transcriptional regulator [Burkholderiaceae bacterium]|nr:helix-turn-helix transcriptional regulator [Burkholderiaceae bacterium]